MIAGIPYFGENTQEIYEFIQSIRYDEATIAEVNYESLYELIISNINKHIVVIIDNKYLTWLNDIVFNYRDKECYIPYYSYKEYEIKDRKFKTNGRGHLILNDDKLTIRYEYKYNKLNIDVLKVKLTCMSIDTKEVFRATTNKWVGDTVVNLDALYKLYIDASYKDDDFIVNKHVGGYHYIDRSPIQFVNREKKLREQYGLSSYYDGYSNYKDYRDVRQYKYDEVISLVGMINNTELYRERRLKFEAYLYCCLRAGLFNNIQFKNHIYKLGSSVKLIIKDYWLDNISKPNKTYIKYSKNSI